MTATQSDAHNHLEPVAESVNQISLATRNPHVDGTSVPSHNPTGVTLNSDLDGTPPDKSVKHSRPSLTPLNLEDFELLRLWAQQFHDAQKARIASSNRFTAATKLGASLDLTTVEAISKQAKTIEDAMALPMRRTFRKAAPEIYKWVKETQGLGEHSFARLLGAVGHPVIATPHHWESDGENRTLVADQPYYRSVSQLWAYCGVGDPAARRRKGMSAADVSKGGNPTAKMLVRLIAEGCMKNDGKGAKARSPYRDVYDIARAKYQEREEWTDSHRHNAALRYTGKMILKDLWVVANESLPKTHR